MKNIKRENMNGPNLFNRNRIKENKVKILFCILMMIMTFNAWADLKMPQIFSDNMVLQRNMPIPIWGKANPEDRVTVKFKGQEKTVKADSEGKWMIRLDPLSTSAKGETLTITAGKEKKEFKNVLVGEVWLCSGQSNMRSSFRYLKILEEVEGVHYPLIRLTSGRKWSLCNTENLRSFSAVGYYFGLNLWQKLQIPIGLINISRGSSSIEAWMTPKSLVENDSLVDINGDRLLDEMKKFQEFYSKYESKQLSKEEIESVFLEYCTKNRRKAYLKDGKPRADKYKQIFGHMSVRKPAHLYNSLMALIVPFGIRGVIWYQGETNNKDRQYAEKQKILIDSWRKLWNEGNFPFYIVQIAPYRGYLTLPTFWLEQYKAVRDTKNTGIVSTVDISDIKNCHPLNKRDVGKRLALLALRDTYGVKNIVASGPTFKSAKTVDNSIVVTFDNCGSGLSIRDGKAPDWFEVAGSDYKFFKAEAEIIGNMVKAKCPEVKHPQYVRYGWKNIAEPNLCNKEGLPAFPFNTAEPFFQNK